MHQMNKIEDYNKFLFSETRKPSQSEFLILSETRKP